LAWAVGFDAADVDLLELLDIGEDLRELCLELGDLFLAQMQAGQLRGVTNVESGIIGTGSRAGDGVGFNAEQREVPAAAGSLLMREKEVSPVDDRGEGAEEDEERKRPRWRSARRLFCRAGMAALSSKPWRGSCKATREPRRASVRAGAS